MLTAQIGVGRLGLLNNSKPVLL